MKIALRPEVVRLLAGRNDAEEFVNSLVVAYCSDQFIRRSEVAGMVVTRPYYRSHFHGSEHFDAVTQQFHGVTVEGARPSESLFIASDELQDLLKKHQVVLVMKSPREKKIETKRPSATLRSPRPSELT